MVYLELLCSSMKLVTHEPLYNMLRYSMVLDITSVFHKFTGPSDQSGKKAFGLVKKKKKKSPIFVVSTTSLFYKKILIIRSCNHSPVFINSVT